jgi:hypothetical protein
MAWWSDIHFPLPGRVTDFHRLDCAHTGRTVKKSRPQYAFGASKKFDIRIEFVPDAVNTPNVVWRFGCNFELMPEVADMVVDCPVGVVVKVFVPHKVYYHVIGEYPLGIHNEQGEDVKLFHCQYDLGFTDIYNPVFQTEIQTFSLNFCQPGIRTNGWSVGRNTVWENIRIATLRLCENILHQFLLLANI